MEQNRMLRVPPPYQFLLHDLLDVHRYATDRGSLNSLFMAHLQASEHPRFLRLIDLHVGGPLDRAEFVTLRVLLREKYGDCGIKELSAAVDAVAHVQHLPPSHVWQFTVSEMVTALREDVPVRVRAESLDGAKPTPPPINPEMEALLSLRRVGQVWHMCYHDEQADFPVKGNQFLGWLAKLLAQPNKNLTVAELWGDPKGKITADARLGGERAKDKESLQKIWSEIQDIDAIAEEKGWTDGLTEQKNRLLKEVARCSARKRLRTGVGNSYNNITTQKRQFLAKLKKDMPRLAAHLRSCLQSSADDLSLSYQPPAGTPIWIIKNPSA
jgi:hypothetical protein